MLRSDATPRLLLVGAVALYIGLWTGWQVQRHHAFGTFGFDFGIWDQGMWLLSQFETPFVTIMGVHLFGDHTTFILLPLVPLYWLFPGPYVLIVLHAAALGIAAVPAYLLARELLRNEWLALGLAVAYLANAAMHWTVWEQFHPDVLEVPLVLLAFWLMVRRRWTALLMIVFLLLMVKEDVPLFTVAFGVYVAVRYHRRVGLAIVGGSLVYLALVMWVIFPYFNEGQGTLDSWRIPFDGPGGLIRTTFTRPWDVAAHMLGDDKPWYAFQLFAMFGLASLLAPGVALLAAGPLAFNLLSTFWYQYQIEYHYTTLIVPVLAAAAIFGVARVPRGVWRGAAVGVVLVAALFTSWWWGPSQYSRNPQPLGDSRPEVVQPLHELLEMIPADASVSAHYGYVTRLTHRREIYEFPVPWHAVNWGDYSLDGQELPRAAGVEYIMVPVHLPPREAGILERLRATEFDVVAENERAVLLKRREPPR